MFGGDPFASAPLGSSGSGSGSSGTPTGPAYLQEDASSYFLLEDGTYFLLLESEPAVLRWRVSRGPQDWEYGQTKFNSPAPDQIDNFSVPSRSSAGPQDWEYGKTEFRPLPNEPREEFTILSRRSSGPQDFDLGRVRRSPAQPDPPEEIPVVPGHRKSWGDNLFHPGACRHKPVQWLASPAVLAKRRVIATSWDAEVFAASQTKRWGLLDPQFRDPEEIVPFPWRYCHPMMQWFFLDPRMDRQRHRRVPPLLVSQFGADSPIPLRFDESSSQPHRREASETIPLRGDSEYSPPKRVDGR